MVKTERQKEKERIELELRKHWILKDGDVIINQAVWKEVFK